MNPAAGPFPAYNTLPVGMSYQQMQQMAAATRASVPHNMNSLPNMRPDSQLSFNSQNKPIYEERHYQNIQLYQLNPRTASPIGASTNQLPGGAVPPSMAQPNTMMLPPNASRPILHGSHSSLQPSHSDPSQVQTSMNRPVSALVTSREQEQIFTSNVAFTSPGTPTAVTPRHNPMMHSASSGPEFFNYPQQHPYGTPQLQQRLDPRQRDLMRQEAKMEEMREELRRREDRIQQQQQHGSSPYLSTIPRGMSLSNSVINSAMLLPGNTNSIRPNRFVSQQTLPNGGGMLVGASQSTGTLRHPGQINTARSVHPPPPAPKPLRPQFGQQQTQQQPQQQANNLSSQSTTPNISYRYGPSGYPPAASSKSNPNMTAVNQRSSGVSSPSPWEREEKEKVCYLLFKCVCDNIPTQINVRY